MTTIDGLTSDEQILIAATNKQLEELWAKVSEGGHAGALLAEEDADGEDDAVAVGGLEELTTLEAFGCAKLFGQACLDFVELCFDFRACK